MAPSDSCFSEPNIHTLTYLLTYLQSVYALTQICYSANILILNAINIVKIQALET